MLILSLVWMALAPVRTALPQSARSGTAPGAPRAAAKESAAQTGHDRVARLLQDFHEHGHARDRGIEPPEKVGRIPERDVNDYIVTELPAQDRLGLKSVELKLIRANYLGATAIVDFDRFRGKATGTLERSLLALLSGNRKIYLEAAIRSTHGTIQFELEKAYIDNIRLPVALVEKVANWIGPRTNSVIDLSKAYPLPYGLKKIEIETGTLVLRR